MVEQNAKIQKTLAPAKRGRKPQAGKKFKATKFDKDLVKLIQSGVTAFSEWCRLLGVDESQARSRVALLVEKGFLAPDAKEPDVYRLGIDGYNKYGSLKIKPVGKDGKNVPEKTALAVLSVPAASSSALPSLSSSASPSVLPTDVQVSLPRSASLVFSSARQVTQGAPQDGVIPKASSAVDLAELLAKGAPGGRILKKDGSMCELCRSGFKVSIKEPKLAKFAHCVCGAAYHQDCHQSLLEGASGCVRCGRKLSAVLDQGSQEALKFVKDAFE